MSVQLLVVQGKERGKCLNFPQGEFVFGRGQECHVRPNSELVSRQHCILSVGLERVLVRDLGSTNGTLVNGRRVLREQVLHEGDRLQLGPVVLLVKFPQDKPPDKQETIPETLLCPKGDTLKDSKVIEVGAPEPNKDPGPELIKDPVSATVEGPIKF
jgi:pSer/pThr/pTyr-binding forkhead associated (FHA) protein